MGNEEERAKAEKIIQETTQELVSRMGFEAEVEIKKNKSEERETLIYNIKTEHSNFLIGQYGINLQALQHLVRILTREKTAERVDFIVDVNSYKQERNESLERLAKETAEQAVREKRSVVLRPMSAYERRIVHVELSKNSAVKTESVGEGEDRKVVIKPAELA